MYSSDEITVELIPVPPASRCVRWKERVRSFPKEFFKGIRNGALLIRHRNLLEPLQKAQCPMRALWKFTSPFYTSHITSHPAVMKAIYKHFRNEPEGGLFLDQKIEQLFLPVLQDLFPNDTVLSNDFLFTAQKEFVNLYRQPILKFLNQRNIAGHSAEIESIVSDAVASWGEKAAGDFINAGDYSFRYASNVISKFLLGHPGPDPVYDEIAKGGKCLIWSMMKRVVWQQKLNAKEQADYNKSLDTFREAIDFSLNHTIGKESFIAMLREEKGMTELQIKTTLFLMYFAGTDAPGSVLSYILWQLGRHPEFQEEVLQEMAGKKGSLYEVAHELQTVENLFNEGMRLYTPVYLITRFAGQDFLCVVKDKAGTVIEEQRISKKQGFACCPTFTGRNPAYFKHPDVFDPHRYQTPLKSLFWLPFGDAKHTCPGQWIAKAEIVLFLTKLIREYTIESLPETEPKMKGHMTIQPETPYQIRLKKRSPGESPDV